METCLCFAFLMEKIFHDTFEYQIYKSPNQDRYPSKNKTKKINKNPI